MKHIVKPPMPSSDEFLDLLGDPVVFAARVREYREAVETLNARIDVATTFDDAQRLKLQAQARLDDLTERQRVLAVDRAALQQERTHWQAECAQREGAYLEQLQELQRSKTDHANQMASARREIEARNADVVASEMAVTERETAVLQREAAIQQEELAWQEKVAQLFAILGAS